MAFQINNTTQPKAQKTPLGTTDVDFFEETIIFKKMNVLMQSGAFALTQSKTLTKSIFALLRGVSRHN